MTKYRQFIFENYLFDRTAKTLTMHYSLDGDLQFTEIMKFNFEFTSEINADLLDAGLQTLFLLAGISYYKTYIPPEIVVRQGRIDKETSEFLAKTYQRGLGEFFYVNNLDPRTVITFPITAPEGLAVPPFQSLKDGALIGLGGGKDSLVSVELMRNERPVTTWSLGHGALLAPLVEKTGLPHITVDRTWDPLLLEVNRNDAYNGHVPISAIFAAVGTVVAILAGIRDVVVSNEASANEPTLTYRGQAINHQYSKSLEFEQDFQAYLTHRLNGAVRYYSLLRPFSELRIAEMFAKIGFETYKDTFTSCNRAFRHGSDHMFWCGECPKCAFVFLALTPFIERQKLEDLFGGKNLLLDSKLEPTYRQLLGIQGDKPLECVGAIKESRAAMRLAQATYPQLAKYVFELPDDYDFRALAPHSLPEDILPVLG